MNIYPQPSAPSFEPKLQFQYITYPEHMANPQYITQLPLHIQSYYNQNYHNNIKASSKQNYNNCFTNIAKCIAFLCCCFVVDETIA